METYEFNRRAYVYLWVRLLLVTAASIFIYVEALELVNAILLEYPGLAVALQKKSSNWVAFGLKLLAGVLFCWRTVKVIVLHGSPFRFGMAVEFIPPNISTQPRQITCVYIGARSSSYGDYIGKFWFGTVFRAHPNSDKLMRSRLDGLIAALPFGYSLEIRESRLSLTKRSHEFRAMAFENQIGQYIRRKEN